jgi:hypothetical protein
VSLPIKAIVLALLLGGPALATATDPGRLFFTPAQRAQLEAARERDAHSEPGKQIRPGETSTPLRYDGVLIRSDGRTTRWVNGKAQSGAAVQGLKPGQIRADGKVYEPYQVLRPSPAEPDPKDPAP